MSLFPHELKGQLRLYWRSRELAFFTFLLPIIMFVLLGSVYGNDRIKPENVRGADYLLAGMLGYGAISIGFAGMSIMLVIRRESGILKRLRATPLPAAAYIGAVLTATLAAFAVEAVTMVVLAHVFFNTHWPSRLGSLVLALLLGTAAFTALGVALTAAIRSAEGSSALVNAIYLPLSFVSGAFFSPHHFPQFLRSIADVLPLTFVIRLVRDTALKGVQIWDRPGWVAVVAAWGLAGTVVALRRFRWEPSEG
jgi:ABC-2 type transport system permease protein